MLTAHGNEGLLEARLPALHAVRTIIIFGKLLGIYVLLIVEGCIYLRPLLHICAGVLPGQGRMLQAAFHASSAASISTAAAIAASAAPTVGLAGALILILPMAERSARA